MMKRCQDRRGWQCFHHVLSFCHWKRCVAGLGFFWCGFFFYFIFLSALEYDVYFSRLVGKIPCKLFLKTCLLSLSRNSVPFHVYI